LPAPIYYPGNGIIRTPRVKQVMIAGWSRSKVSWHPAVLAITALSVFMSGCDTFTTFQRLGVSPGPDGAVQVLYLACDYEELQAVTLFNSHDVSGGEDDELLWEIRSEAGSGGGTFPVGSRPDGFVESVEFAGSYPAEDVLIASVEIEGSVGAALEFTMDDLEPGNVWTTGKPNANFAAAEFEEQARESCEPLDSGGP
jgi:hypothetical protein